MLLSLHDERFCVIWMREKTGIVHYQLLSITLLKFNSSVLLNLQGNISPYCLAVEAISYGESTLPIMNSQEGQCWSCNWECVYCDSSQETQWNIAWALGISFWLMLYFIVYPSSRHNTYTYIYKVEKIWWSKVVGRKWEWILVYTNKQMHVEVCVDPRRSSST